MAVRHIEAKMAVSDLLSLPLRSIEDELRKHRISEVRVRRFGSWMGGSWTVEVSLGGAYFGANSDRLDEAVESAISRALESKE